MEISQRPYKKLWIGSACIVVLLFAGVFAALWTSRTNTPQFAPFTLTDHNGTLYDSHQDPSYKLIYFGFTHCPDVCPAGLRNMHGGLVELGELSEEIRPLFITIDAGRDTPEVLKDYTGNFHPRLLGLTGTWQQVEDVQKAYAVYAKKLQPPEYTDYVMDHSAHLYLTDKHDMILDILDYRMAPEDMAARIRRHIRQAA